MKKEKDAGVAGGSCDNTSDAFSLPAGKTVETEKTRM